MDASHASAAHAGHDVDHTYDQTWLGAMNWFRPIWQVVRPRLRGVIYRTRLGKRIVELSHMLSQTRARLATTRASLATTRERLATADSYFKAARPYLPLYRQGLLADAIVNTEEDFSADCYIALLPSSLPAAFELRRRHGGRVFCDCVENVDVHKHSVAPNWSPVALDMVNGLAYGALSECDGLVTIGEAIEKTLVRFGRPCFVLKNFREFEQPAANDDLRSKCALNENDVLLFASGNVVVGFEPVIEALHRLPAHFHLAAFVRLKPPEYQKNMEALIGHLGLRQRVHFFPFVAYDQLVRIAAGADIGLITSDISNPNGAVGLPNRCFDYLTGGLPVVAPPMPDVRQLIDLYGFGRIVEEATAEHWTKEISTVADNLDAFRDRALKARCALTWESQEQSYYEYLGRPKNVTLIGFRDLSRYQRFLRLARSLKRQGCAVKLAFFATEPDHNVDVAGAEFFYTSERYGLQAGLKRITGKPATE